LTSYASDATLVIQTNITIRNTAMKKTRNDFTVRPNQQSQRVESQPDLWDVVIGRSELITTVQGQEGAQAVADMLNKDCYALYRGQTRADNGYINR